jgi:hypothetical protein
MLAEWRLAHTSATARSQTCCSMRSFDRPAPAGTPQLPLPRPADEAPRWLCQNDAFTIDGAPALNTRELYFDGNSQGAILGGALCAVARDFRRCELGEAGMNYSTLLNRSVDFDIYKLVLDGFYPDPFTQLLR